MLLLGCTDGPDPLLEIGVQLPDGGFRPLEDGDGLPIEANTWWMVLPSLRIHGVDPRMPDVLIEVWIGSTLVAGTPDTVPRRDLEPDGDGYMLWRWPAFLFTETCCATCQVATVRATLVDAHARTLTSVRTLFLSRPTCPDVYTCCGDANLCPDPGMATVCL